jgi:hypothetical protein
LNLPDNPGKKGIVMCEQSANAPTVGVGNFTAEEEEIICFLAEEVSHEKFEIIKRCRLNQ